MWTWVEPLYQPLPAMSAKRSSRTVAVVTSPGSISISVCRGKNSNPLTAVNATVPEGMTRADVEAVMRGMAMVDEPMTEEMGPAMAEAVAVSAGSFRDADSFHKGGGSATIYRLTDGSHVLRLKDFSVTNGPDLRVILSPHPSPVGRGDVTAAGYVELGKLKGNIGDQNYPIDAGVDVSTFNSVVIYCKPFHVLFSAAEL